jgi:hypothetical protein
MLLFMERDMLENPLMAKVLLSLRHMDTKLNRELMHVFF